MNSFDLAVENLTSPPILAFVLGAVAVLVRSDLRLPDPIHTWISTYLLLAIGLKGGHALRDASVGDMVLPIMVVIALGVLAPIAVFFTGRRFGRLAVVDAGSVAAHYGSVSVVTFTAALLVAEEAQLSPEPFMTTLVALLEIPGIIVALVLTSLRGGGVALRDAVHEVLTGRSVLLLIGGLAIGAAASDSSFGRIEPFFSGMFTGLLTLFLLDMGATVAKRLGESGGLPARLVVLGLVLPIVLGVIGVLGGRLAGLSEGGIGVFAVMIASASYIAAPAAVRTALPQANTGLSLGMALGVTFPFNLLVGIPLFFALARQVA